MHGRGEKWNLFLRGPLVLLIGLLDPAPVPAQVPWGTRPYTVAEVDRPARVEGRIVLLDPRPRPEELQVTSDFACCGKSTKWKEDLIIGDECGLANAVVLVEGVPSGKPFPTETVRVDQRECVFKPHVVVAYCGQGVHFVNSDPILHNVHAYMLRGSYDIFNIAMPPRCGEVFKELPAPGAILLTCDAGHRWMSGYVFAADNPYVTRTDEDGRFQIDGIPPGRHEVKVWHESLGEASIPVELAPSATVKLEVECRLSSRPHLRILPSGPTEASRPHLSRPGPDRSGASPPGPETGGGGSATDLPRTRLPTSTLPGRPETPSRTEPLHPFAILGLAVSVMAPLFWAWYRIRTPGEDHGTGGSRDDDGA